jgi:multidrug efflux pump subunit AcrA (membrane-fusion protein)
MASSVRRLPLLAAAALLLTACGRTPSDQTQAPESTPTQIAAESARQVRVELASIGALVASKQASVTIASAKESRVAAGASGRVEQVLARPGSRVEQGATVIVLDADTQEIGLTNAQLALESARINLQSAESAVSTGLEQLRAQVRAAESNLELAQGRLEEGGSLFAAGGIARTDLAALEAQASQAESTFLQARDAVDRSLRASDENLALLQVQVQQAQNGLAQAQDALAETRIVAPFAGEVVDMLVEEGEFVGAGSQVFRLVGTDEQLATFTVSPEDAQLLQERGTVYVRYAGLDYGAEITRATRPEQQPRLVTLSAALYPAETPIPNGTVAELRYQVELARGVIVSSSALSAEGGRTYVFVVDGDSARRREVVVLAESGSQAAIEGVAEGTPIISPRPLDVREGTAVQVVEEASDP